MKILLNSCALVLASLTSTQVLSEVINAEKYIQVNGYTSVGLGDDGKTKLHTLAEHVRRSRFIALESDISSLQKNSQAKKACDGIRGNLELKLSKQQGSPFVVVLANYGFNEYTYACALKYSHNELSFSQLMYFTKGSDGLYTVGIYEKK